MIPTFVGVAMAISILLNGVSIIILARRAGTAQRSLDAILRHTEKPLMYVQAKAPIDTQRTHPPTIQALNHTSEDWQKFDKINEIISAVNAIRAKE